MFGPKISTTSGRVRKARGACEQKTITCGKVRVCVKEQPLYQKKKYDSFLTNGFVPVHWGANLLRARRTTRQALAPVPVPVPAQALVRVQETDSCPRRAASRLSEYKPRLGGHACAAQRKLRTALPSCPCCSHPSRAESGSSRPAVDPAATPQGLCSCHRRVPRAPLSNTNGLQGNPLNEALMFRLACTWL